MSEQEIMALLREAFAKESKGNLTIALERGQKLADLGFDSMSALSLAAYVEDRLGVTFADAALSHVASIGDFVDMVQSALKEAS